jgi:hypothetical protein
MLMVPSPGAEHLRIAVLPFDNLSGSKAPVKEIRHLFMTYCVNQGLHILDDKILMEFMEKHRIRYTGAINRAIAQAFKEEIGVEKVLLIALELYDEKYPPKFSITSRLVSTGNKLEILWTDNIGLTGDDSPGILGLGLIEDPLFLLQKVLQDLSGSLTRYLSAAESMVDRPQARKKLISAEVYHYPTSPPDTTDEISIPPKEDRRFLPKAFYRSPVLSPDMKYTIAIMPFLNKSHRKYAGDIMVLHFVKHLKELEQFNVIEPGIVRQDLLRYRIIMNEGISFANAGLIFSTIEADADLILSGTVMDYQDYQGVMGTPKVDFSVLIIEKKSREIVWTSKSYNTGNEGVFFFDRGKINTANTIASQMTKSVSKMIVQ